MSQYEILMLFHSHVRTYPTKADGTDFTTGERFADIFRQMKKAAVMRELIDDSYTAADDAARAEVETELGLV